MNWDAIHKETVEDFRKLLRFRTVNPPGDEGPLAEFLVQRLEEAGLEPEVLESNARPNVLVRLASDHPNPRGALLMTAHMDVVPVEEERWTHPPFDAVVSGDYLYGRGAVDMKNMLAMCLMIARQLALEKLPLTRDVIFAFVSDEEEGCTHGSRFLVEQHPERVRAECLIGEVGGFSLDVKGKRYYPIQIAEKGRCRVLVTAHGEPGHGSIPHRKMAIVRLAEALQKLGSTRLPQHRVPTVQSFIERLAETQGLPASLLLPKLLDPRLSGPILRFALEESVANTMAANLSNTASPTILSGGEKNNVIPGEARALLDGRLLPGQSGDDLIRELAAVIKADGIDLSKVEEHPGRENPGHHPLYDLLASVIKEHDPEGIPIPYMSPGFTDACWFGRLVPYCYGFAPLRFPKRDRIQYAKLPHAHNERIYLPGFAWGARVLWDAVTRFCTDRSKTR